MISKISGTGLALFLLISWVSVRAEPEPKVAYGDDPWLISEFRQGEQTVVVDGDVFRLTPEASASLSKQIDLRMKQQQQRKRQTEADTRFAATVVVGKDAAGMAIITSIAVH